MKPISKRKKHFILKHFDTGEFSRRRLAKMMKVSESTVYRVKNTSVNCKASELPEPKKCGRKPHVFTVEEIQKTLEYRDRYKASCNTLERLLKHNEGVKLAHNQMYKLLKVKGLIRMQKKKRKKNSWVRFERKHSLSMYQGDWKLLKNGNWLIAFKDDASRVIVASGESPEATAEHSIEVLTKAIREWGRPREVLTGRDVQFYASDKKGKPSGKNKFQLFLKANGIKHVLARVKHPQTCGKIERFFGEVEKRLYKWHDFKTVDEVVHWHNYLLPSLSLDYDNCETPVQAFRRKMHHKRVIIKEVVKI